MNHSMKYSYLFTFLNFLKGSGKHILFTIIFYSIWIVTATITSQEYELKTFSHRMIGIATLNGYDVGARVAIFYKGVALFFICFLALNFLGYFIHKKITYLINSVETRMVNYISLAGIVFFLFQLFDFEVSETIEIVYFLHKFMLGGIILKLLFFKSNSVSTHQYTIILLLAVAGYFLVIDCNNLLGYTKNNDFYIVTFIIACVLITILHFFLKSSSVTKKQAQLSLILYALVPVTSLPFVSILKDEIFLVLQTRGYTPQSQVPIYFILIIILLSVIIFRYKHINKRYNFKSHESILAKGYAPLSIISLIAYVFYSYFINYNNEAFESANKYLPVMEYKLFGVIPTIEKFNSHLLHDYLFSAVYTFFNGMQTIEMELYDFLGAPICYVLYYYLFYYLSRNVYIAMFFTLLFPLYKSMMPDFHSFGIIALFALHKITTYKETTKTYLLFFITIFFLILWRIDVGYTCAIALPFILIFYHFNSNHNFKINWKLLFKSFLIFASTLVIILFVLSMYRNTNLFFKLKYVLNYLTSAQTYGYLNLSHYNSIEFKMHYFVFPFLTLLILLASFTNYKSLNQTKNQRLAYLSIIFLCTYYIFNFNRGLIRHSLIEATDTFLSSFIYIIIPGAIFVLFPKQKQTLKFTAVCVISFFLLTSYKVPNQQDSKNIIEMCIKKTKTSENLKLPKIKNRVVNAPSYLKNINSPFINFIKTNTKPHETFIDFTNNPMLYFYTQKVTPSFFYQNPLCSHNEFLQKQFIKDLENYDAPYLVYSIDNNTYYDAIDDVPNSLRHYRMAEYFYNNYEPYISLGKYNVWKRKDVNVNIKKDTLFSFNGNTALQPMPTDTIRNLFKPEVLNKKYAIKIVSDTIVDDDFHCIYNKKRVYPYKFLLNDSTIYYYVEPENNLCELLLPNRHHKIKEFRIIEYENFPEYNSYRYIDYNFNKLPYIWGTYDKELLSESILFENKEPKELNKNKVCVLEIPVDIDKTKGNTIIITCKNQMNSEAWLTLCIGNKNQVLESKILMNVRQSNKEERYAIRVSSIYKWYDNNINQLRLYAKENDYITISKIQITKEK